MGDPSSTSSARAGLRSEEHPSELQSLRLLVCRLLLEKKKNMGLKTLRQNSNIDFRRLWRTSSDRSQIFRGVPSQDMRETASLPRLSQHALFFNDTATTEIYTLSLHAALPICHRRHDPHRPRPARIDHRRPPDRQDR